eukprot:CAMPEP_0172486968 /NCGR_PEP_ID=MMETSP1066-20121228/15774_1 /TAXON_ID=671091 /ORGANISM="Coscinodiscus wailesii, Strain CCMP2513" /LENGTH=147 /DNA_ID=CAMNT_0013253261 /DNA_START=191 /DNA_END=631 /DNA_ORIENTATION=-
MGVFFDESRRNFTLLWQVFWLISGFWNLAIVSKIRAGEMPEGPPDATAKLEEALPLVVLFGISYALRAFFLCDFLILIPISAAAKCWAVNSLFVNGFLTKSKSNEVEDDVQDVRPWRIVAAGDLSFALVFVWFYIHADASANSCNSW